MAHALPSLTHLPPAALVGAPGKRVHAEAMDYPSADDAQAGRLIDVQATYTVGGTNWLTPDDYVQFRFQGTELDDLTYLAAAVRDATERQHAADRVPDGRWRFTTVTGLQMDDDAVHYISYERSHTSADAASSSSSPTPTPASVEALRRDFPFEQLMRRARDSAAHMGGSLHVFEGTFREDTATQSSVQVKLRH
jgi:hypothetical protein